MTFHTFEGKKSKAMWGNIELKWPRDIEILQPEGTLKLCFGRYWWELSKLMDNFVPIKNISSSEDTNILIDKDKKSSLEW